jgi:predicted Zn finger-like uncharacterized protein
MMASQSYVPDITCPTCGARYRIEAAKRRSIRRVRCKRCAAIIKVLPIEEHRQDAPIGIDEEQIVAWLREGQHDDDSDS